MKRFVASLIVLVGTFAFTLFALWFSVYTVGWIGYLFDASDINELYGWLLSIILFFLVVVTIVFISFKRTRIYSLFIIPHLFPLLFVAIHLGNSRISYEGYGYVKVSCYHPFDYFPPLKRSVRTLTGKIILADEDEAAVLVCDERYIHKPLFWASSMLYGYKIWDLDGNLLFEPNREKYVGFTKEYIYTISLEKRRIVDHYDTEEEGKFFYNVLYRFYDFEGNYIITEYFKDDYTGEDRHPEDYSYIEPKDESKEWKQKMEEIEMPSISIEK